ncbi:MAG: universal stress protein [Acidobacteria bacterium]|nr:universal stress protein [Acidobacteriota bacterium]
MRRLNLRHILCPIDFSSLAPGALAVASAMARARKSELRALHVSPSDGAAVPRELGSTERQALMSRLRTSLAEAAPSYDLIGGAVRQGDPGTQILHFARTMRADVIVMGAPGADRPERPMGPVASVVIARADCPVLAVPARRAAWSNASGLFGRIVCAVDLAPSSLSVIRQALSLAWETSGHLTYVCVLPEGDSNRSAAARDRLLDAIPAEVGNWCEIDVTILRGPPAAEIARIAWAQEADLVVIGAPRRWTSTTHAVLGRSLCPVLVTHDARPLPRPASSRRDETMHAAV